MMNQNRQYMNIFVIREIKCGYFFRQILTLLFF
ncbi:hypothetical protein CF65_01817 [Aggregatibacter actinomycetemcomitans HK1651]|nr:hypothetical protein CF65_01817 [Aggregatibacter actinomycetemcomitans HK1651]